jgi:integrase
VYGFGASGFATGSGLKSWAFRFKRLGRTREMGLGSIQTLGLAEARDAARNARQQVLEGVDQSFVFPSARGAGKPLSNMAFLMQLLRMWRRDITAHGFRSTFRDWCAEATNYPHELAEMALAHMASDKVEAAYRRGDMLEKRRQLMADWAAHCE